MIKIYGIDEQGFYIEGNDAWMNIGDTPPNNYVVEPPPQGYVRPQFVEGSWHDAGDIPTDQLPKTIDERIQIAEEMLDEMRGIIEALEARVNTLEGN